MFGSSPSNVIAQQPQSYGSLRFTSSCFGAPIPLVWGQMRTGPNIVWYGDFQAVAIQTGGGNGGGGKGGGASGGGGKGGSAGSGGVSYQYYAAIEMSMCHGPIDGVATIWVNKQQYKAADVGFSVFTGSASQAPWSYLTTSHPGQDLAYRNEAYLAASNYRLTDIAELPQHTVEIQGISRYGLVGAVAKTFTVTPGNANITSNAHGFTNGLAVQLSSSGTLPAVFAAATDYFVWGATANTFQLLAKPWDGQSAGAGPIVPADAGTGTLTATPNVVDSNPAVFVPDFLSNGVYGVGFTSGQIANMASGGASFSNWCVANGLFLSPALDSQQQARKLIDEVAQVTNCDAAWIDGGSGTGKFYMIPRGDASVSGFGATYTPNLTPLYSLTDDDYIPQGDNEPPIKCTRTAPADAYNDVQLEFYDRTNQYNAVVVEAKDQTAIDQFMPRVMPVVSAHSITLNQPAQLATQLILQRALYVRNQYVFNTSIKFSLLEPGDLIQISDSGLGLVNQLVRILKTEYSAATDQLITFTVEEVQTGTSSAPLYGSQAGAGANVDYNIDPGQCSTPFIFDAPGILGQTPFEIWCAVAGGDNWGGCEVWVSTDNATYARAGKITNKARYGVLAAQFPTSSSDPDLVSFCQVDLTVSQGQMLSGSQADADLLNTLCMVGEEGELISYETAILSAPYKYSLGRYLRRGVYNTPVASAPAGTSFARLDEGIFKVAYDQALIGSTLYFKFLPFNRYGNHLYQLSQVTAIPFVIGGPAGAPDDVTGFTATQNGALTVFSWNLIAASNIAGYEIRYQDPAALVQGWDHAFPLTQVTKGTSVTSAKLPPGGWNLYIKAHDTSNRYSVNATEIAGFVVSNLNNALYSNEIGPTFFPRDYAVHLGGTTADYLSSATDFTKLPPHSFTGQFGFSWWVIVDALPVSGRATLMSTRIATKGFEWQIDSAGKIYIYLSDGTNTVQGNIGTFALAAGQRYNLAMALDGTAQSLTAYVNGVAIGSLSVAAVALNAIAGGGGTFVGVSGLGTSPFKGTVDQFLASVSLSAARALAIYLGDDDEIVIHNPVGKYQDYAYETFDEGSGTTAGAFTLNGNCAWVSSSMTSKFVLHPSGVLVPDDQFTAAHYDSWAAFDAASVPNPFEYCKQLGVQGVSISAPPERLFAIISGILMPGETGDMSAAKLQLQQNTFKYTGAWQDWDFGVTSAATVNSRVRVSTAKGVVAISAFKVVADKPVLQQQAQSVVVAPGGTTITYPLPYADVPNVQVTSVGASGLIAVAAAISATQFTAHVYNTSGTDVGGTVNWQAEL